MSTTSRRWYSDAAANFAVWLVLNGQTPTDAADAAGLPRARLSDYLKQAGVPDRRRLRLQGNPKTGPPRPDPTRTLPVRPLPESFRRTTG